MGNSRSHFWPGSLHRAVGRKYRDYRMASPYSALEAAFPVSCSYAALPSLHRMADVQIRLQLDIIRQRRHGQLLFGRRTLSSSRLLLASASDRTRRFGLHPSVLVHARFAANSARVRTLTSLALFRDWSERTSSVYAAHSQSEFDSALRSGRPGPL